MTKQTTIAFIHEDLKIIFQIVRLFVLFIVYKMHRNPKIVFKATIVITLTFINRAKYFRSNYQMPFYCCHLDRNKDMHLWERSIACSTTSTFLLISLDIRNNQDEKYKLLEPANFCVTSPTTDLFAQLHAILQRSILPYIKVWFYSVIKLWIGFIIF